EARTIAFGITVPKALGDFLVLDAVYATGGTAVAVSDQQLLAAQRTLTELDGTFICPEGAACFAALEQLRESGWVGENEEVVVLNTGAGIKYPETVELDAPLLGKTEPIPARSADESNPKPQGIPAGERCGGQSRP